MFSLLITKSVLGQHIDSVVTKEEFSYNLYGGIRESTFQINNGPVNKTKILYTADLGGHIYPMVDSLMRSRFYNLPIFKVNSRNDTVINAHFFEYEANSKGNLKKLFVAHIAEENLGTFDFSEEMISVNPNVQPVGPTYELESAVDLYNASGQPLQITEKNGLKKAMIYDEEGRVIATVANALFNDVGYYYHADDNAYFNSRNLSQYGNWIISSVSQKTFTKNNLDATKTYVLTFIGSSPNYTVQGGTVLKTYSRQLSVHTINTLYVKGASTLKLLLNSGSIEHLRIFPRESLMENINYGVNNTVTRKISPNFDFHETIYDFWDRPIHEITNGYLNEKSNSYEKVQNENSLIESSWDRTKNVTSYDALGKVTQKISNFNTESHAVSIFKYDNINRLIKAFDPFVITDEPFSNIYAESQFDKDTIRQAFFF